MNINVKSLHSRLVTSISFQSCKPDPFRSAVAITFSMWPPCADTESALYVACRLIPRLPLLVGESLGTKLCGRYHKTLLLNPSLHCKILHVAKTIPIPDSLVLLTQLQTPSLQQRCALRTSTCNFSFCVQIIHGNYGFTTYIYPLRRYTMSLDVWVAQ